MLGQLSDSERGYLRAIELYEQLAAEPKSRADDAEELKATRLARSHQRSFRFSLNKNGETRWS